MSSIYRAYDSYDVLEEKVSDMMYLLHDISDKLDFILERIEDGQENASSD